MMENKILIVDDDIHVLSALKRTLYEESYTVYTALNGMDGMGILKENRIKLVISDEQMPGMSGNEFLSRIKEMFPEIVRIMLTGHASLQSAMKAVNNGEIYRFFSKPWDNIELKLAIRSAIEKYNLEAENRRLLKTVKTQAKELETLEHKHPGITRLERDEEGNLVLPELSDEELSEIVTQYQGEK